MTNHSPTFTSSSATGSFTENANTTGSTAAHALSGTMAFRDSDKTDTHTTTAALKSAVWSGGSTVPSASLAHFNAAMSSQILTDSNGNGTLKWMFSDADDDFDFLAKNETLVLTYNITVSDNHGGSVVQTVKITVTGTDDKPTFNMAATASVTEQANHTLSITPDTVHVALNFTDVDLNNTGHTATVLSATATGSTAGIIGGTSELMSFFGVDNVVKAAGSSSGVINTTFSPPDLAFDYLAAGEQLVIDYKVRLDDHAGGVSTQDVLITVIGTNDRPIYLSGPESAHLTEGVNLSPAGNLNAHGDLLFTDIDLSDTHTVTTTVAATRSGGGAVPLSNAALLAAMSTSLFDSTGHLLGDVGWSFALANSATSFLSGGETLTLTYNITVHDPAGGTDTQSVTITVLGVNHPVAFTSGPDAGSTSELADTTGSAVPDSAGPGTLTFADQDTGDTHTVAVTVGAETWSGGAGIPAATQADLASALTTTLHDSTGTGTGSIDWSFAAADHDFDFLAAGETLQVTYNVKVSDASTSDTETVTITVNGANDAVAITSGPGAGAVAEQPNTTNSSAPDTAIGTLSFTDVDLSDTHAVNVALTSAVWLQNPDFIPAATLADLQSALTTLLHDSTGTGSGSLDWTFSIQDKDLDFLAANDTLTATYDVTVMDGSTSSTQTVTITITGAEDSAVVNPATASIADTSATDAGSLVALGNLIQDAGDTGGDLGNTLSLTEVNGQAVSGFLQIAGAYGTVDFFGDGTYLYFANSALDNLAPGVSTTEQFNVVVTDSFGHGTPTTLTFNVTGSSEAPTITAADAFGSVTEDAGPNTIVNGGFETGDTTGWSGSASVEFFALGGGFGNYGARLVNDSLSQDIATTPGQHYTVSFYAAGDVAFASSSFTVNWDGVPVLATSNIAAGFNFYTFDVVGDASQAFTHLEFATTTNEFGFLLDQVQVQAVSGPPTETADGSISFSDVDAGETHTASFAPQGGGYFGTFSLDPVSEAGGSGSVAWHFTVDNADIQFLSQGQTLTQTYTVFVTDDHGASTAQDVTVAINGANDAPTAVADNVITDADVNGSVFIPDWALARNDTDPDMLDHLTVGSVESSTDGSAFQLADSVLFIDDATAGGSFTYKASDGIASSANAATVTITNNAASTTTLNGTGGNDILVGTNGSETLSGGGGNDILIGNSGTHTLTGGAGDDIFAFQSTGDHGVITDFNNTTAHDQIAISAGGFGGGLTPGQDVSFLFETSGDDQFSGFGAVFHFDTGNQTLYFSADGTTASAVAVTQVQAGVTLTAHDLLIV